MDRTKSSSQIIGEYVSLEPKWYALFLQTNQEKRVANHLEARGVEHFLPLYESERQWKDRRVKLKCPLFPGYLFVRMPFVERIKALSVPHVIGLVGPSGTPAEIPQNEIEGIRRGVEHHKIEPHPYLKVGQRVLITEGAMAGMEGVLVRMHNGPRVVISLDSIQRAFMVEIYSASVAPIETPSLRPDPILTDDPARRRSLTPQTSPTSRFST